MYDNYHLNRCDAMEWLAEHHPDFPGNMAGVPMRARWCSENLFNGWRFVLLESGEWVFADCLSPCIRAENMEGFKLPALQRFNIKQL